MLYFKSSNGKASFGAINNAETETKTMTFYDASSWAEPPTLDREGVMLASFTSSIKDMTNREEVSRVYGKGAEEMRSELFFVKYNPAHKWIYFRDMTPRHALIFRAYETDNAGPTPVPHGAFTDPSCPKNAVGRMSAEARVYVIFDE